MANKCAQLKINLPRNRNRYSRACKMPGGAVRNGKCFANIFVGEQEKIVPGKLADESQLGGLSRLLEVKADDNLTNLSFNNTSKNPTDIFVNQHQTLQESFTEIQNNSIFDRCKVVNAKLTNRSVISRPNGSVTKTNEPVNGTVGRSKPFFDSAGTGKDGTGERRKLRFKCSLSEVPDDRTRNSPEEHLKVSGEETIHLNSISPHPKPLKKRYREVYSNGLQEQEGGGGGGIEEELAITKERLESLLAESSVEAEETTGEIDDPSILKSWSPGTEETAPGERRVTRARACKGLRYQQFMFTEAALPRKKHNRKKKFRDLVPNVLTEKTAANHSPLDLPPPPSDPESDEQMDDIQSENRIMRKGGINSINYKKTKYDNNINNNNNSVIVNTKGQETQVLDESLVDEGFVQRGRSQNIKKVDLDSSDFTDASLFPLAALATVAAAEHDQRMASRLAAASHPFF